MNNVFVDTNVIIDFLADRKPFSDGAAQLFQLAKNKEIKLYIAAISVNNTYYILRKVCLHSKSLELIGSIDDLVEIIPLTQNVIRKAIKSGFKDFEDALQYYSALNVNKVDVIVTRNAKDFKKSEVPVLDPDALVKLILFSKNK